MTMTLTPQVAPAAASVPHAQSVPSLLRALAVSVHLRVVLPSLLQLRIQVRVPLLRTAVVLQSVRATQARQLLGTKTTILCPRTMATAQSSHPHCSPECSGTGLLQHH